MRPIRFCVVLFLLASSAYVTADVLTQRNNNLRTGAVRDATFNAGTFAAGWHKRGTLDVGGRIYAQPLYAAGVAIPGAGAHDVVYVATSENQVSAFDAGTRVKLWGPLDLGTNDRSRLDPGGSLACDDLSGGGIGIEATPVIDRGLSRLYVSYRRNNSVEGLDPLAAKQMLRAIDIRTGSPVGPDVEVSAPGFNPVWQRSRTGLLEMNGVIYVAYGSRCEDIADWHGQSTRFHGWIMAYDAASLAHLGTYAVTPPELDGGGIWQASSGLAADGTSIYFISGNRFADRDGQPRALETQADSIVRVVPSRIGGDFTFTLADWFTPYRHVWLDATDMDLGSAGPMLIPNTHYLVGGGKQGLLYVLDRGSMGKLDTARATAWQGSKWGHPAVGLSSTSADFPEDFGADQVQQKLRAGFQQYIPDESPYLSLPGAPVAAAAQADDQLDVFSVGTDGALYVTWENGGNWSDGNTTDGWNPRPYPQRITPVNLAPQGASVAAARQSDKQLDAFVVGSDGALRISWVVGTGAWAGPEPLTPAGLSEPGGCVAVARQGPNQLDAFVIGKDGAVYVTWVVGEGAWAPPARITPTGLAPATACVALAQQGNDQLDAFVVGLDGAIHVTWVGGEGGWAPPERITQTNLAPPGAHLTAASQTPSQLDVFVVGTDGAVWVSWAGGIGGWNGPARLTTTGFAPAGSSVAAAEQVPNQLDVFAIDMDGTMQALWIVGLGAWTGPVPVTPGKLFPVGAHLAAAKQTANQLDVFAVSHDGAIRATWVVGAGLWSDGASGRPQPARLSRALWMLDWGAWPHIHGTPVFGRFPDRSGTLYVWPEKDHLKSYPWLGSRFDESRKKLGTDMRGQLALAPDGMPGGMLSLAIDPTKPRSGVLFASLTNDARTDGPGILRAFDAVTLRELWNNAGEDYVFSKFVPPTIAAGQVFLPTCSGKVIVYGK